MKRIGILTFFRAENYGGDLQAYALQKKLNLLGYNAEVINQLRPINKGFILTNNFDKIVTLDDKISRKGMFNTKIAKIITYLASLIFHKREKLRKSRFADFENEHIRTSEKTYYNFEDIYKDMLPYNIYIVGSDQVWNYTNPYSPEPYFLTFVKKEKKIAYAASIGQEYIPEEIKPLYIKWLQGIDHISIREKHIEQLIKDISGKSAVTVLDPTLLLTKKDWIDNLKIQELKTEPFLLIYTLSESPYIYDFARHIAKEKNLKIKRIVPRSWVLKKEKNIENIFDAGPIEFVQLFAAASFVLTNSFHGTAFSVNFNIPFFAIPRKTLQNKSRFISLLNIVNLSDRLLFDGSEFPDTSKLNLSFNEANEILSIERKNSTSFVTDAINSIR